MARQMKVSQRFLRFLPRASPLPVQQITPPSRGAGDPRFTEHSNCLQNLPATYASPKKRLTHETKYRRSGPWSA